MRCLEPNWRRIGTPVAEFTRRSLWLRINWKPGAEEDFVIAHGGSNVESFELCAGREGDDSYILVDHGNPQFSELLDVMLTALYAVEVEESGE
jgi:hypothetical protein